ncbi:cell division protein FtsL [Bacillus solitudinis]|uniref:cell division protein FtsL n=1 Tax=Bacillus solitudinis TaxID=2014074 RepID=UPI000C236B4A|nr:cell division protein FtsL [Bacillus solitudinis]
MSMVARNLQQQQEHQEQQKINKRKQLRVEKARITKGEKLIIASMVLTMFLVVGFIIHNYATIYSLNREAYVLESSIKEQTQVNEGLSLQVVELSAPDRILELAEKSGMSLNDNQVKVVQN